MLLHTQGCMATSVVVLLQARHVAERVVTLQLPRELLVSPGHLHPQLSILGAQLI